MISKFTSFLQVANYINKPIKNLSVIKRKSLYEIGVHLQNVIQKSHGKYGLGWLTSTSSPVTPLVKTGGLKNSVSFNLLNDKVVIYSQQEWLALIHEYGIAYKMSDKQRRYLFAVVYKGKTKPSPRSNWGSGMITIPPRPIWRLILNKERKNIANIFNKALEKVFI